MAVFLPLRWPPYAIFITFIFFGLELVLQTQIPFLLNWPTVPNIVLGLLLIVSCGLAFLGSKQRILITRCQWLAMCLYGYAMLSLVWSQGTPYLNSGLLLTLPLTLLNLVAVPLVAQESRFRTHFASAFLLFSPPLLFALIFMVRWEHRSLVSANGFEFGNPLELSSLSGVIFALSIVYYAQKRAPRMYLLAILVMAIVVLFAAASRGQIVAAFAAALFGWACSAEFKKSFPFLLLVTAVGGSLLLFDTMLDDALTHTALKFATDTGLLDPVKLDRYMDKSIEESIDVRISAWGLMLSNWAKDPVSMVVGMGNSASYDPKLLGIYPHSVPIEILTEEGIVGVILFLLFVYHLARRPFMVDAKFRHISLNQAAPFLSLFMFFLVVSLKQGNLISAHLTFLAGILAERSMVLTRRDEVRLSQAPIPSSIVVAPPR